MILSEDRRRAGPPDRPAWSAWALPPFWHNGCQFGAKGQARPIRATWFPWRTEPPPGSWDQDAMETPAWPGAEQPQIPPPWHDRWPSICLNGSTSHLPGWQDRPDSPSKYVLNNILHCEPPGGTVIATERDRGHTPSRLPRERCLGTRSGAKGLPFWSL